MIVHVNPDLDAVTCVALAEGNLKAASGSRAVHLIPAGAKALPVRCPCHGTPLDPAEERVLDHPLGEKGRLDPDGTRHAAACSMPEAADADPDLLAEVDEQDSTGRVLRPRFSLARVVAGLRQEGASRGLSGEALDRYVLDLGGRVIRGLQLLYQARRSAEVEAESVPIVMIGPYKFAILRGGSSPELGITLASQGIVGSVYVEGFNLGVTRYPGYAEPDLRRLAPHLPGWFVHSAGFLAAWGSRKNPAKEPPPEGTPQSSEELIDLMKHTL